MGLINAFNEWKSAKYDNHVSQMKEINKCPDCYGKGYVIYPVMEFTYQNISSDCPGCNGSGQYSDWQTLS
ncbi:MAG TPA: methionine aminopeptidase [Pseudoneobacillus sp.]|nr:methionine aminopeptidase [Pseudoneobacillus sp.]